MTCLVEFAFTFFVAEEGFRMEHLRMSGAYWGLMTLVTMTRAATGAGLSAGLASGRCTTCTFTSKPSTSLSYPHHESQ